MLKAMPKGSVLHLHNTAAVSSKWVIKNLTYRSEAKLCEVNGTVFFTVRYEFLYRFFSHSQTDQNPCQIELSVIHQSNLKFTTAYFFSVGSRMSCGLKVVVKRV